MANGIRRKVTDPERANDMKALERLLGFEPAPTAHLLGIRPTTYYEYRRAQVQIPDYMHNSVKAHYAFLKLLLKADPEGAARQVEKWCRERVYPNEDKDEVRRKELAARRHARKKASAQEPVAAEA